MNTLFLVYLIVEAIFALPAFSQESEDLTIERDSVILKGRFYKAAGDDSKPVVILLQGSPGNTYDVLGLGRSLSISEILSACPGRKYFRQICDWVKRRHEEC